eukprot:TRINITY_DN10772_c0_g1_i1.p1 TRINITY_DN10772_c0_g1~~TRINITY_DN10772_c0_g1_i1.p1  ORF type:complete len:443 (+),score=103.41 TRINITY_DN10772_c0_g1_i1:80-1330(+)
MTDEAGRHLRLLRKKYPQIHTREPSPPPNHAAQPESFAPPPPLSPQQVDGFRTPSSAASTADTAAERSAQSRQYEAGPPVCSSKTSPAGGASSSRVPLAPGQRRGGDAYAHRDADVGRSLSMGPAAAAASSSSAYDAAPAEAFTRPKPSLNLSMNVTTEVCPHCSRSFSSEAAARHIPICKNLKSRPKPPSRGDAGGTDALGVRQGSRGALSAPGRRQLEASPASTPNGKTTKSALGRRSIKSPSAASQPVDIDEPPLSPQKLELRSQWAQLEFLLCDGLDAVENEKAVNKTLGIAESCLQFLERLDDTAGRLSMRTGALARLLLPFDLNTDAGYQANSAGSLGSSELAGLLSEDERREMVGDAVSLRRLIRVKIADCADVQQAFAATDLLVTFLRGLKAAAEEQQTNTAVILRDL